MKAQELSTTEEVKKNTKKYEKPQITTIELPPHPLLLGTSQEVTNYTKGNDIMIGEEDG